MQASNPVRFLKYRDTSLFPQVPLLPNLAAKISFFQRGVSGTCADDKMEFRGEIGTFETLFLWPLAAAMVPLRVAGAAAVSGEAAEGEIGCASSASPVVGSVSS